MSRKAKTDDATGEEAIFARKLIRPFATMTINDVINEIRAVTKLCQRGNINVVNVISHGPLKHSPFYAIDMEFCNLTLAEYMTGKRDLVEQGLRLHLVGYDKLEGSVRRWSGICNIMLNIADGLEFIHGYREVHRDLKPSNGSSTLWVLIVYQSSPVLECLTSVENSRFWLRHGRLI